MAFALANPRVATILFGATSPSQVRENVRAAQLVDRLSADQLAALRALGG
jgi:aryl-alcohol dehydrogenase-like predicted oxidoreductase